MISVLVVAMFERQSIHSTLISRASFAVNQSILPDQCFVSFGDYTAWLIYIKVLHASETGNSTLMLNKRMLCMCATRSKQKDWVVNEIPCMRMPFVPYVPQGCSRLSKAAQASWGYPRVILGSS